MEQLCEFLFVEFMFVKLHRDVWSLLFSNATAFGSYDDVKDMLFYESWNHLQ